VKIRNPLDTRSRTHLFSDDPLGTGSISPVKIRDPLHTRSRTHMFSEDPLGTRSQVKNGDPLDTRS